MARYSDQSKKNDKSQPSGSKSEDVTSRKKNLTLDIQAIYTGKKGRLDLDSAPVLNSPDLKKLKLKSPEMESIIMQQNTLTTATPNTTNHILFPKLVTEEQENYAKGFMDALNELHGSDSSQGVGTYDSNSSSSMTYTDLDPSSRQTSFNLSPLGLVIKDEPQTVPNMSDSPHHFSPIDMECQEKMKLEKKRQRNRVAASKCRRRKLERIARLESKVKDLKNENNQLAEFLMKLKDQVYALKGEVLQHVNSGCELMNYCPTL